MFRFVGEGFVIVYCMVGCLVFCVVCCLVGFFGTGGLPRPRYGFGMVDLGAVIKLRENHRGGSMIFACGLAPSCSLWFEARSSARDLFR